MLHQIKDRLEENNDRRQSVKSLFKMFAVLECFSSTEPELSVLQIARLTGLPRTTVHRLVDSLRIVGFLDQDGSWERYRLGLKLFELGNAALINLPLYRNAGPFIDTLAKLSGETVHLWVFDGTQMIFVERYDDRGRANNVVTTMEATSCHSTGVGKAALAFQPEAVINRIIDKGLKPFTRNTIVDPGRLRQELGDIRARGYAIDNCEHEPDLRCVAAPISNSIGRVFAAMSVSGNPRRIEDGRIPELANLVMAHAKQISVQLGYRSATTR